MAQTPTLDGTKSQATSNLTEAAIAGGSVAAGNVVLGPTFGPMAGGVLAGASIGGNDGDQITKVGFMLGANNLTTNEPLF